MENAGKIAKDYFTKGYNCCQAVVAAFSQEDFFKESGLTLETAVKIASSFGGGMGRLREVCGAVSGMFFIAGLKRGYNPEETESDNKKSHYELIQEMAKEFKELNGSIICRELLGLSNKGPDSPVPEKRTDEYYKKRPCGELVEIAANIAAKL